MYYNIDELVEAARRSGASDVHLVCGLPPKFRLDGQLENMSEGRLSAEDCEQMCRDLARESFDKLEYTGELDFSRELRGIRCRCHVFKQQRKVSAAVRLLSESIPRLDSLGLPPSALEFTRLQVGKDTASFSEGLRASLREDPDVILIGEMRDKDTIETAITAAETGHLVFGTLHTGNASDAIDRMVQVFPEGMQNQIRLQLSMTLMAVVSQQLVKRKTGGRVLASEVMVVTDGIRNMIRGGNTPQIANAIATSASIGGQTMDQSLVSLVRSRIIDKSVAMEYAHDETYVRKNA